MNAARTARTSSRVGAHSTGHRKVFAGWNALIARYERLPRQFTASDLDGPGISGGRRHLLVRFFAEHPAFACELVSRQPLAARKRDRRADRVNRPAVDTGDRPDPDGNDTG